MFVRLNSNLTFSFCKKVTEHSLESEKEHLIKLMEFERIKSSYFRKTYYIQNLYKATFFMADRTLKTFVVQVNEREVYR